MDCARLKDKLIGYHFGALADDETDAIDEHLLSCAACLRTYLTLKRANRSAEHRPSAEMRARLRQNVKAAVAKQKKAHFLFRRIPVYQGLAAAALAAAVTLVAPKLADLRPAPSRAGLHEEIDTSRQSAKSFRIY
jgi:anti-sigma factor RsiW